MIVHVALPIPVRKAFSYAVPQGWVPFIEPLVRVKVPFKNRNLVGFIVGVDEGDSADLKEVLGVVDLFPLLDENSLTLAKWASRYYIAPEGLVLRYALPAGMPFERYLKINTFSGSTVEDLSGLTLKKAFDKVGSEAVHDYFKKGLLRLHDVFTNKELGRFVHKRYSDGGEKTLFLGGIHDRLLYYIETTARHIDNGENVLMLVADHHRTGQFFFDKLSERFPGRILRYGVSVTAKKRMEAYFRSRCEGGSLILGSRSCLFLPVYQNGCIIVERPEEDEYRNEEGFRFNAVDLALRRAEIEGVPIVLGSISPPLDTYKRAMDGEFHVIDKVYAKPRVYHEIISEKGMSASGNLPEEIMTPVARAAENREVIAIYTPRKDYSSHIKCLDCKSIFRCPVCGGGLSYQKHRDMLVCSDCGRTFSYNDRCQECGSKLIQFTHVGVEYLEHKVKDAVPGIPIIRVAGDTFRENKNEFMRLCAGEPAIIIGTQALAKPYGLKVNKLIMIEWEELMRVGGYRAGEKMLHILSNLVDTLDPEELYVFMTRKKRVNVQDFLDMKNYYSSELERRKQAQFPPYVRIFLLEVEKDNESAGLRIVAKIKSAAVRYGVAQHITGPLMQKRKGYRWRLILKGNDEQVYAFLSVIGNLSGVRVETDPVNI